MTPFPYELIIHHPSFGKGEDDTLIVTLSHSEKGHEFTESRASITSTEVRITRFASAGWQDLYSRMPNILTMEEVRTLIQAVDYYLKLVASHEQSTLTFGEAALYEEEKEK